MSYLVSHNEDCMRLRNLAGMSVILTSAVSLPKCIADKPVCNMHSFPLIAPECTQQENQQAQCSPSPRPRWEHIASSLGPSICRLGRT